MFIKPKTKTSLMAVLMLPLFLFTIVYTSSSTAAKALEQTQPKSKLSNVYIAYPKLSFDKIVKNADLIAKVEIQSKISETSKKPYKTLFQAKLPKTL